MKLKKLAKKLKINQLTIYTATGKGSCPFNCSYCFLNREGKLKQMSEETLYKIIDFLQEVSSGSKWIHFIGTEPLFRFDLIQKAREYAPDFQISLTTNGWLLDDKRIAWMAENNVKIFMYSIDGGPAHHNKYRRTIDNKPTWARVAKNFRKLLPTQGKWMTARATWAPAGNDYDLVGRFKALEKLGARDISVLPVLGDQTWEEDRVAQAYIELADYYKGADPPSWTIKGVLNRLQNKGYKFKNNKGNLCLQHKWSVLPDGTLLLCHRDVDIPEWRIGNIYSDSINKVALSIFKRAGEFYKFKKTRSECKQCIAKDICPGIGFCPADNQKYTGDVLIPPKSYCIHLRGFMRGILYWINLRKKKNYKR